MTATADLRVVQTSVDRFILIGPDVRPYTEKGPGWSHRWVSPARLLSLLAREPEGLRTAPAVALGVRIRLLRICESTGLSNSTPVREGCNDGPNGLLLLAVLAGL